MRRWHLETCSFLIILVICWFANANELDDSVFTLVVAVAAVPYLIAGPSLRLAWLLGALLPVYTVWGTPSLMWDGLRLCVIAALIVRAGISRDAFTAPVVALAATGLGFLLISSTMADLENARYAASLLLGVATAVSVGPALRRPCLTGFAVGAGVSAAAVMLEVGTGIAVGSGYQGTTGFIGLGSVSTNTGPQLALAVAVVVLGYTQLNQVSKWLMAALLSIGTVMAGSRAGFMALVLFVAVMLVSKRFGLRQRLMLLSALAVLFMIGAALHWAAVDRLLGIGTLSVERSAGIEAGIRFFMASPITGVHGPIPGVTDFSSQNFIYTTYLNWPAYFGLFGVVAVVWVFTTLALGGLPWQVTALVLFVACLEFDGLLAGGSILPVILLLSMREPTPWQPLLRLGRPLKYEPCLAGAHSRSTIVRAETASAGCIDFLNVAPGRSKC